MDNFIEIYKQVLTPNFCNAVIEQFNKAEEMGFTENRQKGEGAHKLHKDDNHLFYPSQIRSDAIDQDLIKKLNEELWNTAYKQYADKYSILSTLPPHGSYCSKIQKTKPGEGYHVWHCEHAHNGNAGRILTWTVYLNDTFEAGETEFLYQQYRYKPQQGDIVIFPAAFTHTHRGNPPIGGDKYIITGWIEY
jgi:hypothetical protein